MNPSRTAARALALPLLLVALTPAPTLAEVVALTGATVHTLGPAGTLEGATVVIADGLVRAVGSDLAVPAGARRLDASGKVITPGLFDSLTRLGLVEVGAVDGTRDDRSTSDRLTAAFRVTDGLNPRSTLIAVNRAEGLTHALVAPQPGPGLLAGQAAVIHLGTGNNLVAREPAALFAVLGEAGAERAGSSRGAAFLTLREALADARDHAAHREEFDRGQRRPYALSRLDLAALAPVARGEVPLLVQAHRASDLLAVLRLAEEEGLRLVIAGAAEGWMVAGELAAAGVPVLLDPMANLPGSFETLGATLENAARLHAAGVTVAFMTGDSHNARNLKQAAGNAAAHGLPWDEALAAMTRNPARIWGLGDRLGTLEPGKEATLVVWDGDPLEVTTFAERVFLRGEQMPSETRQRLLRERYRVPAAATPLPPAYRRPE